MTRNPIPTREATLERHEGGTWSFSATTDGDGRVDFRRNNYTDGCYETTMDNISASGLEWDGQTPDNEHCKP